MSELSKSADCLGTFQVVTNALRRDRYYVLVAACVLGRGSAWLRSACLAAALLLPAVAALHGIVLAAIHVDGKADPERAEEGIIIQITKGLNH